MFFRKRKHKNKNKSVSFVPKASKKKLRQEQIEALTNNLLSRKPILIYF